MIVNYDVQNVVTSSLEFLRCELVELISTFSQSHLVRIIRLDLVSGPRILGFLGLISIEWR